jgi:hypothetical protein
VAEKVICVAGFKKALDFSIFEVFHDAIDFEPLLLKEDFSKFWRKLLPVVGMNRLKEAPYYSMNAKKKIS